MHLTPLVPSDGLLVSSWGWFWVDLRIFFPHKLSVTADSSVSVPWLPLQDSSGLVPRCTTEKSKSSVGLNRSTMKSEVIYLTREGDKVNYSDTNT